MTIIFFIKKFVFLLKNSRPALLIETHPIVFSFAKYYQMLCSTVVTVSYIFKDI